MKTKFKSFLNERLSNYNVAKKIAFELGEEINEFLGNGAFGRAYSTKSGKVIKLTSDRNEVNRAFALSRNKNCTKYLINYYNVGRIESTLTNLDFGDDGTYSNSQYYILMDQVFPLSDIERKTINLSSATDNLIDSVISGNILSLDDLLRFEWYTDPSAKSKCRETMKELYPHIINIAKELKKHHITGLVDFHGGNVGWDKDRTKLVFFDIGGYTKKDNYKRNNKKIIIDENKI